MSTVLRRPAEELHAAELQALMAQDSGSKPESWKLSPKSVLRFVMGGKAADGTQISPKYFGSTRPIEIAIATLATDRGLLLTGPPGTAKSRVSEHLAAAICGASTFLIQGTAGADESALRYGWNYAQLIANGPSRDAVILSPVAAAMEQGSLARLEEVTRMPSEVQDALMTVLSEKAMPIPELNTILFAKPGFNVIGTANDRDRGIFPMSAALRRRFNVVRLSSPTTLEAEVQIVQSRVTENPLSAQLKQDPLAEIRRVVQIFRELRNGVTEDGKTAIRSVSSGLSTSDAIDVCNQAMANALFFGESKVTANEIAPNLVEAVVRDTDRDGAPWQEYVDRIIRNEPNWADLAEALEAP
jgi:MoxR-like ATPase